MAGPMDHPRRCRAHSTRTGARCGRWAIRGGTVCPAHGGAAPQVQRTARQRLDDLVDPAIAALRKAIMSRDSALALKASRDVLKAAGLAEPVDDGAVPAEMVAALVRGLSDLFLEVVPDDELRGRWAEGVRTRLKPRLRMLADRAAPL